MASAMIAVGYCPDDGGSKYLSDVGKFLPEYTWYSPENNHIQKYLETITTGCSKDYLDLRERESAVTGHEDRPSR
jgi:hypothetical protein